MAAMTKTTAVAKMVILSTGRGTVIFNDRLRDGTRSLKVWGWTANDYTEAKKLLTLYGCDVKMVEETKFSERGGRYYTMRRLHVQE